MKTHNQDSDDDDTPPTKPQRPRAKRPDDDEPAPRRKPRDRDDDDEPRRRDPRRAKTTPKWLIPVAVVGSLILCVGFAVVAVVVPKLQKANVNTGNAATTQTNEPVLEPVIDLW